MMALSVKQPWAHLIVRHGKTTENRVWECRYRGPLIICASSCGEPACSVGWALLNRAMQYPVDDWPSRGVPSVLKNAVVYGRAIGIVRVVGCDREQRTKWDIPGQFHLRMEGAIAFKHPFPVRGQLGLYEVADDLVAAALNAEGRIMGDWRADTLAEAEELAQ